MNFKLLIILFSTFSFSVNLFASPTIVRSIETIQCWEDLKGADTDQDYSEPCEKVIEYMLLDASNNLYGIARTARILQSGDKFSTKVYFSVPMSKDHQQSAPEYTLGYLNYVTCDGEQIRSALTGPNNAVFRTDTEGTTGDQGTNCLDGNSVDEYLNTSGTITHSGRSNYFIWQPGRCVTFSNPIDPLNPAVRTKNDCVLAGGQWEDFIPKETTSSPGSSGGGGGISPSIGISPPGGGPISPSAGPCEAGRGASSIGASPVERRASGELGTVCRA